MFNRNQLVFRATTSGICRDILLKKGKGFRTYFYLCYNCYKSNKEAKLNLILKKKFFIIKKDVLDFHEGDIRVQNYWFTIKLEIEGFFYIFDRKTKELIWKRALKNKEYNQDDYDSRVDLEYG